MTRERGYGWCDRCNDDADLVYSTGAGTTVCGTCLEEYRECVVCDQLVLHDDAAELPDEAAHVCGPACLREWSDDIWARGRTERFLRGIQ